MIGKGEYLNRLTAATSQMRSEVIGTDLSGSSPPSVFVGRANYPKVFAGPMIAPVHGDTSVMDRPESWIPNALSQEEIIRYRLGLVRGIHPVHVHTIGTRFVEQLQEIALADASVESEAQFTTAPTGISLSEEHTPFGPSAPLEHLTLEPPRWNRDLERIYYDTDLGASEAVMMLHESGLPFSTVEKAFSVGVMGTKRKRCLVPTRWSITACDSIIANNLLTRVKKYPVLDTWRVHEYSSLHNRYAVILMPTGWQYEWTEAFVRVLGNEELVFSDYEGHMSKSTYSSVGGCYYSCKMAVLEALAREQRQAGVIVLREATSGYIPMGVFNVRENVRQAMREPGLVCESISELVTHLSETFTLPMMKFIGEGTILPDVLRERQTTLSEFSRTLSRPGSGDLQER